MTGWVDMEEANRERRAEAMTAPQDTERLVEEIERTIIDRRCSAELVGIMVRNRWSEIRVALLSPAGREGESEQAARWKKHFNLADRVTRAESEIERLRNALRPFVQAHPEPIEGTRAAAVTVNIEVLREAATALSAPAPDRADVAGELRKRPVAWRVKDFADGWIIFQDEAAANLEVVVSGGTALIQGLYVRDGSPTPPPTTPPDSIDTVAMNTACKIFARAPNPSDDVTWAAALIACAMLEVVVEYKRRAGAVREGRRWRHKKRGTTYIEIGRAKLQASDTGGMSDNHPMVVYRGEDGQFWVRPEDEFDDGRFELLAASPLPEQCGQSASLTNEIGLRDT